jgi:hypothetical protein
VILEHLLLFILAIVIAHFAGRVDRMADRGRDLYR